MWGIRERDEHREGSSKRDRNEGRWEKRKNGKSLTKGSKEEAEKEEENGKWREKMARARKRIKQMKEREVGEWKDDDLGEAS